MPTHLDSHHHSHRHPVVLEVMIDIAREPRPAGALELRRRSAGACAQSGVLTTDHFVERFYGDATTLDVLLDILRGIAAGLDRADVPPGPRRRRAAVRLELRR